MIHEPVLARSQTARRDRLERRGIVRQLCRLEGVTRPLDLPDTIGWGATVKDITLAGLGMVVCYPFKPGTVVAVDLRHGSGTCTLVARVVYANDQSDGTWLVGCALLKPLSPDELTKLL
jgi:hypothetical protein